MASSTVATYGGAQLAPGYRAPTCDAMGGVRSDLFQPDGYALWEVDAELDEGATLRWPTDHGDEVVFVVDGELDVDGVPCGPGTTVIVESGVIATVTARRPTTIVHFGSTSPGPADGGLLGPPQPEGHGVHVLGFDEATMLGTPTGTSARYIADGTCATCRAALLHVAAPDASVVVSHVHSEDEIIRVLDGELQVGRERVTAGMSIAVPAHHRYGFRTPGGYAFINYRDNLSTYLAAPGTPEIRETVEGIIAARNA